MERLSFMKEKIFVPVKSDVIFRLFFADERNLEDLTCFLKSVVKLPDGEYSVIEVSDPHLLREFSGDKQAIVDVKLKTHSGKIIHIEIQLQVTPALQQRIVYYSAKLITEQIGSGDNYEIIKKVISIIITEEDLLPKSGRYHHRFTMYDLDAGVELTDIIEIHTIELEKLPPDTDGTELYDWASFIAASSEEEMAVVAERNPQVGKAVMKFRELSADERTRDLYERREKARRDAAMFTNWEIKKAKIEFAKKLIKRNRPVDEIIEDTGLTLEEVESLFDEELKIS